MHDVPADVASAHPSAFGRPRVKIAPGKMKISRAVGGSKVGRRYSLAENYRQIMAATLGGRALVNSQMGSCGTGRI